MTENPLPALHRRDFLLAGGASAAALALASAGPAAAAPSVAPARADQVRWRQQPFALGQVELLDGPFLQARERDRRYLMSLPNERLLHCFRLTAGLDSRAEPLGGWELPDCELRGHFAGGHYLSACALLIASTGDEAVRDKADALVAGLARCQRADGYLGAYPASFYQRLARHEEVWAPLYTAHKLLAGQLDMALLAGNRQALQVAQRFADWIGAWLDGLDDAQWQQVLKVEFGGVHESLWQLYAITGKPDYRRWARRFADPGLLQPLAERRDALQGLHANTQIPKLIAAARAYEIDGDPAQRQLAEFFWETVTAHHAYATGGVSDYEQFGPPNQMAGKLSGHSHECCCSYNLLKLTRHLYGWQPQAVLMDYYERVLFNARLGTQDEAGMLMYYVPMDAGYWKVFGKPLDAFWCCTGTGSEEFAKTQDSIYFHDQAGLTVNLFIASRLHWPERGLRLTQTTGFPVEQASQWRMELKRPARFELRLRLPGWLQPGWTLTLNDEPQAVQGEPGSYLVLDRQWRDGDRIGLTLPMALQAAPLPDEPSLQAVRYGPLVLAARLGTQGVSADKLYVFNPRPSMNHFHGLQLPTVYADPGQDWARLEDAAGLRFQAEGIDGPVELVPFYRVFGERYAVYCRVRPRWEKLNRF